MLLIKILTFSLIIILIFSCSKSEKHKAWKGSAIIGNGEVCAVYSDDERLGKTGIQHFYFKDYTADYISSSDYRVYIEDGSLFSGRKTIGMANFFSTSTKTENASGAFEIQVNTLPDAGLIVSLINNDGLLNSNYEYNIHTRKQIKTDRINKLIASEISKNSAFITWDNHITLVFKLTDTRGTISFSDSILSFKGKLHSDTTQIIISAFSYFDNTIIDNSFQKISDSKYWEEWINSGILPQFENKQYLEYYKRNLYAAKSANLYGMIPADITGQFVTNNMPQLYPRDAMMTARVFLKTGHLEEAKQIIIFWANQNIPRKSKGEWYARYDAYGKAVNAGSGARYDEPEWDANGYFIQLLDMYHKQTGEWLVDSLQIYEIADFIVNNLDKNNLMFEGGIIEWTGYLPATNMTAAAALRTTSRIAKNFGNNQKEVLYKNAADRISENLTFMFDKNRNTYADVRFAGFKNADNSSQQKAVGDTLYLWDSSSIFGILWGYPDHTEMQLTNDFYSVNTVKHGGGVQYFDAPNQGLAAYGNDMFFFTTAARAQYLTLNNNIEESKDHIEWMINNSNIYGLMPERIYLNNQDCSDASPLSWCCAEFSAALLELYNSSQRSLNYSQ